MTDYHEERRRILGEAMTPKDKHVALASDAGLSEEDAVEALNDLRRLRSHIMDNIDHAKKAAGEYGRDSLSDLASGLDDMIADYLDSEITRLDEIVAQHDSIEEAEHERIEKMGAWK
jgi:flagellar biosynthesis chaperone FliJ